MKILYKLTTRSRPDKMFRAIDNIREMTVEKDPWIIVTLDIQDVACNNATVRAKLTGYENLLPIFGHSKNKIAAFNRDVPPEGWDVIVATSDDIQFLKGFDEQIKKDAFTAAIDVHEEPPPWKIEKTADWDFTIWYGDGNEHGKIMTVPIMTKKYYDRLGHIYHPSYVAFFCDEESIELGEKLNKIYYSEAEILVHAHPLYGKVPWDEQYKKAMPFYSVDKRTFQRRKALNFPI